MQEVLINLSRKETPGLSKMQPAYPMSCPTPWGHQHTSQSHPRLQHVRCSLDMGGSELGPTEVTVAWMTVGSAQGRGWNTSSVG